MEDYGELPEWLGTCIWYYPEWDSRQNKSLALHKWGIDSSKDNSIDAAYNSVAEEIMHSFEDGLSSIGVYDYEADLVLLQKIKILMDEKIEDRDCKSIKGRLMGLRKSFTKDFKDCFDVIQDQGESVIPEENYQPDVNKVEGIEPKVVKGIPDTLRDWITWKIKADGFDMEKDTLPNGYQAELIKSSYKFGYEDDSAAKRACKYLGLKFARSKKRQMPPNAT